MAVFPVVFLLGLMCLAPVLLAVAIGLGYWAWQNRAHWPDPKVFLIVGGVALLLFLMLGVTSFVPMHAEVVRAPIPVAMSHGEAFDSAVPHTFPHHVTVPAPVVVRHYPMAWGLIFIIGLNLLFGFIVVMFWRMSRGSSTSPAESTSSVGRRGARWIAPVVGATATALLLAGLALPALQQSRETARREATRAQLQHLGEVLHGLIPTIEVHPPPVEVRTDLASVSLLIMVAFPLVAFLLVMGLVICAVRWGMRPAHLEAESGFQSKRSNSSIAPVVIGLTAAMVLLGLIGLYRLRSVNAYHATLQTQQMARLEKSQAQQEAMKTLSAVEAAALRRLEDSKNIDTGLTRISETGAASALTPLNNDPLPQADRTVVAESPDKPEPIWLRGKVPMIPDGRLEVIASGQFASIEEARADARRQSTQLLATDLQPYVSRVPFRWQRTDMARAPSSNAIREEYVQQFERDFGSFFAPMYRVWYLVELSPRVREPVIAQVKAEAIEGRTIAAGVAFAAMWLAPLGMVLSARLVRALGGQGRSGIPILMGLVVLCGWIVTAIVLNESIVIFNG